MKNKLQHTLKVSILLIMAILIFASPPVLSRAAEATPETQKESLKETHTLKKIRNGLRGEFQINYACFSFLIKRQTHKTAKTTVTDISIGHTGIGQTPALISLSP